MDNSRHEPTPRLTHAQQTEAINDIVARQAGQISHRQLREIGLSYKAITRRVANKTLLPRSERRRPPTPPRAVRAAALTEDRRAAAGVAATPVRPFMPTRVYGTQAGRLTLGGLRWAAVLSGPPNSVLCDVSTLAAAGLMPQRGHAMHVLHLGDRWDAPKGVIPHETVFLPDSDRWQVDEIPSTSIARSLIDAAAHLDLSVLEDVLDTAVRKGEYDGRAIVRVLEDRPTFRGAPQLERAVAKLDATSGTFRSIFERRTLRLMETSSVLPPAAVNVLLEGFEPDLRVIGTRAIIECDGRDYHRSPAQVARDDERERILRALGFVFLRLRWHHVVYEEQRTLRRIEQFVLDNLEPPIPR